MTDTKPTPDRPDPPAGDGASLPASSRSIRLAVFGVLAVAWLGFLVSGQVRARFWIRNEFQVEFKPLTGVWDVLIRELPGGDQQWPIQALVIVSLAVIVIGVIAGLFLLLMADDSETEPDRVTS